MSPAWPQRAATKRHVTCPSFLPRRVGSNRKKYARHGEFTNRLPLVWFFFDGAYQMKFRLLCAALQRTHFLVALLIFSGFAVLAGCASQEPAPAPAPSTFDRSWSAALSAAQDEGVRITSEDRGSGVIRGSRNEQEVTINLRTQADGSVRVEISARGPKGSDPGLAGRISRAYDRRMGR